MSVHVCACGTRANDHLERSTSYIIIILIIIMGAGWGAWVVPVGLRPYRRLPCRPAPPRAPGLVAPGPLASPPPPLEVLGLIACFPLPFVLIVGGPPSYHSKSNQIKIIIMGFSHQHRICVIGLAPSGHASRASAVAHKFFWKGSRPPGVQWGSWEGLVRELWGGGSYGESNGGGVLWAGVGVSWAAL